MQHCNCLSCWEGVSPLSNLTHTLAQMSWNETFRNKCAGFSLPGCRVLVKSFIMFLGLGNWICLLVHCVHQIPNSNIVTFGTFLMVLCKHFILKVTANCLARSPPILSFPTCGVARSRVWQPLMDGLQLDLQHQWGRTRTRIARRSLQNHRRDDWVTVRNSAEQTRPPCRGMWDEAAGGRFFEQLNVLKKLKQNKLFCRDDLAGFS